MINKVRKLIITKYLLDLAKTNLYVYEYIP